MRHHVTNHTLYKPPTPFIYSRKFEAKPTRIFQLFSTPSVATMLTPNQPLVFCCDVANANRLDPTLPWRVQHLRMSDTINRFFLPVRSKFVNPF